MPPAPSGVRLSWTQPAPSAELLRNYKFVLYVDGVRGEVSNVQCEPGPGGFECSGSPPPIAGGSHTLELAASEYGYESRRSTPITTTLAEFTFRFPAALIPVPVVDDTTWKTKDRICSSTLVPTCFDVHSILTIDAAVRSLGVLEDGRLIFLEGDRRVRILTREGLVDEPALVLADEDSRLVAILVGQALAGKPTVYLAWTERSGPGKRLLTISRFSELDNRLGQGRTLLAGLSLPEATDPVIALDGEDRVYVAFPRASETSGVSEPYGGLILRFGPSGMVPWQTGQNSPRFANGFSVPTAIADESSRQRVWISGRTNEGIPQLTLLPWSLDSVRAFQEPTSKVLAVGAAADITSLAFVDSPAAADGEMFAVSSSGGIGRVRIEADQLGEWEPLPLDWGLAKEVVAGPAGSVFVVVGTKHLPERHSSQIVLLRR